MNITLRKIKESDLEKIMLWRMRPDITKYMNTDPKLTLDGQRRWLEKIRNDATVIYWVLEVDGVSAGVVNLADIDYEKKRCGFGYYIGENKLRSMKLAVFLEWNIYDFVFDNLLLECLCMDVFCENKAVIKLHEMCGSKSVEILKNGVEKNGKSFDINIMEITRDEWLEKRKGLTYEKINIL